MKMAYAGAMLAMCAAADASATEVVTCAPAVGLNIHSGIVETWGSCNSSSAELHDGPEFAWLASPTTPMVTFDFSGDDLFIRMNERYSGIAFGYAGHMGVYLTNETRAIQGWSLIETAGVTSWDDGTVAFRANDQFFFDDGTLHIRLAGTAWSGTNPFIEVRLTAVPEPASWAFMIVGFGAIGVTTRLARRKSASHAVA